MADHHGRHGIQLFDCYEDPRVSDCILTYNAASGLHIVNCHDILVSGNHLTDCARKLAPGAKWIDLGGARDSIARENLGGTP